jgi:transportin-3
MSNLIFEIWYKFTVFYCTFQDQEDFEVRSSLVKGIVSDNGQVLVRNLIHACVFCLHSYMLSDVADVIMELMLHDRVVRT